MLYYRISPVLGPMIGHPIPLRHPYRCSKLGSLGFCPVGLRSAAKHSKAVAKGMTRRNEGLPDWVDALNKASERKITRRHPSMSTTGSWHVAIDQSINRSTDRLSMQEVKVHLYDSSNTQQRGRELTQDAITPQLPVHEHQTRNTAQRKSQTKPIQLVPTRSILHIYTYTYI